MKRNSKAIGNNYEREFAKKLSKWMTGSDEDLVCWRRVSSGSVATIRKKKGLKGDNIDGDIAAINPEYQPFFDKFYIDTKTLKSANFFIINPNNVKSNVLINEWEKVCIDAGDKIPFMPVKIRDRSTPEFVVLPSYCFPLLHINYMSYSLNEKYSNFRIYILDDLFKYTWQFLVEKF